DQEEQELRLEQDGHRAERASDRETPGVAHEDLRGVGVEPEESDGRAHECGAEDGKLTSARQIEEVEVPRHVYPCEEVGERGERRRRNGGEASREAVETIGEVDGIAGACRDQGDEQHVQPGSEIHDQILEEGQRRRRGGNRIAGHERVVCEEETEQQPEAHLTGGLVSRDQTTGLSLYDL